MSDELQTRAINSCRTVNQKCKGLQGAGVRSGGDGSGIYIYHVIHAVFTNYRLPERRVGRKIGTVCHGEDHLGDNCCVGLIAYK